MDVGRKDKLEFRIATAFVISTPHTSTFKKLVFVFCIA